MGSVDTNTIGIGGSVSGGVALLLTLFTGLSLFYRPCGPVEALGRPGAGVNKVCIGGA